ncbi:hypothetical protein [Flavobacterium sangjuense]|uniref:Lipoprotein n=1 Tax=Flavobacterium sangjuense TaxID=2518177 RepID=A0A4P7PX43_9FLAO|nr:hypothetical protein [Flavobacterium sangjuense]QBZ98882.1 hypothetical protein GS03_02394 [Flavobacterium sangjuense]
MKKVIILLSLIIIGCTQKNDGKLTEDEIKGLRNKAINLGDKNSYAQLIAYYQNSKSYDLLPYSFIMAKKYNNPDAFLAIYQDLIKLENNGKFNESLISNLKKEEINYILSLLKRGAELNDIDCKVFLARHYRNGFGVPKNEKIADSLMNSINK